MTIRRAGLLQHLQSAQLSVVDALYGVVTEPDRWNEVAGAVSNLVGGVTAILHRKGAPLFEQSLLASDIDPHYARSYEETYGAINPWALATQTEERDPLHVNDARVAPEILERSAFYTDWLRPQDLRYTFNACIRVNAYQTIELTGVRSPRIGVYEQPEYLALAALLPHLTRAVELSRRLRLSEAERKLADAASRSGTGRFLLDCRRRVLFSDREAEQILTSGGLSVRNGQLCAAGTADNKLGAAIALATGQGRIAGGRSGSLLKVPRPDKLPLSIAVGPLDERDRPLGLFGPLAMVLVTAPERRAGVSEDHLRALFDLTAAEARLVVALCSGETLSTYSVASGTSLNTVKTHLRHVFEKTGETRQADLIRRVSQDIPLEFGQGAMI